MAEKNSAGVNEEGGERTPVGYHVKTINVRMDKELKSGDVQGCWKGWTLRRRHESEILDVEALLAALRVRSHIQMNAPIMPG